MDRLAGDQITSEEDKVWLRLRSATHLSVRGQSSAAAGLVASVMRSVYDSDLLQGEQLASFTLMAAMAIAGWF
jgi:hypothetical protein